MDVSITAFSNNISDSCTNENSANFKELAACISIDAIV
jgi:hypothetical protein